ncbi:hypothetical protein CEXT_665351, partial [Caerostris extrusa]
MYTQYEPIAVQTKEDKTQVEELMSAGTLTAGTFMISPDLTFYHENGTREADAHPMDALGTSRNYKGKKKKKKYIYHWYPGTKEVITTSYDEINKIPAWKIRFANDTTVGSGIYKALCAGILERVKYTPQLYSKQVEFAQGVTFEELSIKDNEFYSEWGIVYPYVDPDHVIRVKSCTIEAEDMELSFITDNEDKYTV